MNKRRLFPLTSRKPSEIIAFRSGGEIRVDHFLAEAEALSRQLPEHRYVINLFPDRYQYLLGFCAAVIADQCTLMPPNRLAATLEQLTEAYPDSYTLGDISSGNSNIASSNLSRESPAKSIEAPVIPADQLCAIAFTSGSTGEPTPNLKYWGTLRTGSIGSAEMMMDKTGDRINLVSTVPAQHMWGFETSILLPLFADAAISHLAPFYPQDIADALDSVPRPRALVSSPVHLRALLKSGVSLVEIERIFTATAPLTVELAQALQARFNTSVLEIFGCSESGILAVRKTASETLWLLSDLFELEPGEEDTLIRSHHLPDDVILPDVVELTGAGQFRWLGRHQDMINVAGKRGSLADLNHRLLAIPGVIDGVIFLPESNPERLAALVVAPGLSPADILRALKLQIEAVFLPRPVYMIPALPRQETGKLARAAVQELYEKTRREWILAREKPESQPNTSDRKETN